MCAEITAALRRLGFERVGCIPALPIVSGQTLGYDHCLPVEPDGREWSLRGPGVGFSLLSRSWTGLGVRRVYSLGWGLPYEDPRPLLLLEAHVPDARAGVRLAGELDTALAPSSVTDLAWAVAGLAPRTTLRLCARTIGPCDVGA